MHASSPKPLRVAVAGVAHNHVRMMMNHLLDDDRFSIVAIADGDPTVAGPLLDGSGLSATYTSHRDMFAKEDCDVVLVGDIYADRGSIAIDALEAGKHVLADKPLCTSRSELDRIAELAAQRQRVALVALNNRYRPCWRAARQCIATRALGDIISVNAAGHHPLRYGSGRQDWYFQPHRHGGTFNDLAVHALDGMDWLLGARMETIVAAHTWNRTLPQATHFEVGAQAVVTLDNGASMSIDCSYCAPQGHWYGWLITIYGTRGSLMLHTRNRVELRLHDQPARELPPIDDAAASMTNDLWSLTHGNAATCTLTTEQCLRSTNDALRLQGAAVS
jgi:predicted dehydrogenase